MNLMWLFSLVYTCNQLMLNMLQYYNGFYNYYNSVQFFAYVSNRIMQLFYTIYGSAINPIIY